MSKPTVARWLLRAAWLGFAVAHGLASAASAQTLQLLAQNQIVRVGYIPDQAPFAAKSANGPPTGYALDLCAVVVGELEARVGKLATAYVELAAGDSLQAVADGRVDLLCGAISETLSRREIVDFSEPIFVTGASAVVRSSAPRILRELVLGDREVSPPRSLEMTPFAVIRVGVREGTTTQALLRQAVTKGGYHAIVTGFSTHAEGWSTLERGAIDAYFADRVLLGSLLAAARSPAGLTLSPHLFSREVYAIALRRGDTDLRLLVDRALTKFYGSPDFAALLKRYFATDAGEARSQISALATPE